LLLFVDSCMLRDCVFSLQNQETSEAAPRLSISGDDQHRLISTRDTFPAGCE
jgi:hypothetical protein